MKGLVSRGRKVSVCALVCAALLLVVLQGAAHACAIVVDCVNSAPCVGWACDEDILGDECMVIPSTLQVAPGHGEWVEIKEGCGWYYVHLFDPGCTFEFGHCGENHVRSLVVGIERCRETP